MRSPAWPHTPRSRQPICRAAPPTPSLPLLLLSWTCTLLAPFLAAIPTQRLTEAAEKAKIELSALTQTSINLPFITATADGPKHIDLSLTRAKFEEMCSDLLERCKIPVLNVGTGDAPAG